MPATTPRPQDLASFDTREGESAGSKPVHRVFYPALDGVRSVAFLMVFFHHYLHNTWGWAGVDIFFVLSGFLITGILFQTQDRPHRFRTFYTRRVLRIFPLYYGVFAVLLLLTPLLRFQWNWYWLFWVFHLGNYLRNFAPATYAGTTGWVPFGVVYSRYPWLVVNAGHFWSLCVEEQFYLLWPVVVFTVRRRGPLLAICVAYFLLMLPVRLWMMHAPLTIDMLHGWMGWAMPFRADALLLGGALALWSGRHTGASAVQSRARVSPVFAAALAVVIAWAWTHDFRLPPVGNVFTYPLVDIAAACMMFEALRPSSWVSIALSWRPLRHAGKFTYGAYVFHDLPHSFYARVAQHWFRSSTPAVLDSVTACIALPCTALLAWVSFRYYETPFLKWKDRLARE